MSCKGLCSQVNHIKMFDITSWRNFHKKFEDGYKMCTHCEIKLKTPAMYCPCCSWRLRLKPRNNNDHGSHTRFIEEVQGIKRY